MGKERKTINLYNPFSKKREDVPCENQCPWCVKHDTTFRCRDYYPIPDKYILGEQVCPSFVEFDAKTLDKIILTEE